MMLATDHTVELGRLRGAGTGLSGPRHRLLYLGEPGMVVLPYCRTSADEWECVMLPPEPLGGRITSP